MSTFHRVSLPLFYIHISWFHFHIHISWFHFRKSIFDLFFFLQFNIFFILRCTPWARATSHILGDIYNNHSLIKAFIFIHYFILKVLVTLWFPIIAYIHCSYGESNIIPHEGLQRLKGQSSENLSPPKKMSSL